MKLKYLAILLMGMLLFSCNPLMIKADFDVDVDFSKYETYSWVKIKSNSGKSKMEKLSMNPFIMKRIKKLIEKNLMEKGLKPIENKKEANLLLAIYFHSKKKVNVSHISYGYGYGYRYGGWYNSGVVVNEYKEGTMVIDLIDAQKRELVWRGIASGIAHKDDYSEEDVEYIVGRILRQYPPTQQE